MFLPFPILSLPLFLNYLYLSLSTSWFTYLYFIFVILFIYLIFIFISLDTSLLSPYIFIYHYISCLLHVVKFPHNSFFMWWRSWHRMSLFSKEHLFSHLTSWSCDVVILCYVTSYVCVLACVFMLQCCIVGGFYFFMWSILKSWNVITCVFVNLSM